MFKQTDVTIPPCVRHSQAAVGRPSPSSSTVNLIRCGGGFTRASPSAGRVLRRVARRSQTGSVQRQSGGRNVSLSRGARQSRRQALVLGAICSYAARAPYFARIASSSSATMLVILIAGLTAGPAVSL